MTRDERGEHIQEHGTCRRSNGEKIHRGHRSYHINPETGKQWYVSIGADCNSNGQFAGRDFKEGYERQVTCTRCLQINGQETIPTPTERVPGPDSCEAMNKTTGKQCTFQGYGTPRRCNTHKRTR